VILLSAAHLAGLVSVLRVASPFLGGLFVFDLASRLTAPGPFRVFSPPTGQGTFFSFSGSQVLSRFSGFFGARSPRGPNSVHNKTHLSFTSAFPRGKALAGVLSLS